MTAEPRTALAAGDALLVVDVQLDFCPGGALPVVEGHDVARTLAGWIAAAGREGVPVYASRDWHPPDHVSFAARGGPWPAHCVQRTLGASFHPALALPEDARIVTKGDRADRDQYSAFDGTDLADRLRREGILRLWVGGLAEDVCVRATVVDALREGFGVHLIAGATRPVDPDAGREALAEMVRKGAILHA